MTVDTRARRRQLAAIGSVATVTAAVITAVVVAVPRLKTVPVAGSTPQPATSSGSPPAGAGGVNATAVQRPTYLPAGYVVTYDGPNRRPGHDIEPLGWLQIYQRPSSTAPTYPPLLIRTLAVGSLPAVEGPELAPVIVHGQPAAVHHTPGRGDPADLAATLPRPISPAMTPAGPRFAERLPTRKQPAALASQLPGRCDGRWDGIRTTRRR